ncbi:MAG TPA: GFA family protein [Solirubrobacteraceae bacterium]|nr:GFA family protein [Solirubrobacteraceae bacterium]
MSLTVGTPPEVAGYCHCTRCQGRTGTSASAQALVDGTSVSIDRGEELVTGWRHPDGGMEKCFCSVCGGHVFSRDPDTKIIGAVRMSAFDGDPGVRPSFRAFITYAAPWEPVPDDGLERFEESRPR